jgi:hypothetical protein
MNRFAKCMDRVKVLYKKYLEEGKRGFERNISIGFIY